jgi:hypothetical protein
MLRSSPKGVHPFLRRLSPGCVVLAFLLGVAACSRPTTAAPSPQPTVTVAPATILPSPTLAPPTPTPQPTATPEPLALTVNGQDVLLSVYERETARCQAGFSSVGVDPSSCPAAVMQSLIERVVIEQAASSAGVVVPEADIEAQLTEIINSLGGPDALETWLQSNLYSAEAFRAALSADMLRARVVAQVAGQVGDTAEQVHARAILVAEPETAQIVLGQVQAGADFATLALTYSRDLTSRAAGGDLGWFPRGILTVPEVETAAFALEPGQTSEVIQSAMGYHIVQVIERDPARGLSPAAAQVLQAAAFDSWLADRLAQAQVTRHIEP